MKKYMTPTNLGLALVLAALIYLVLPKAAPVEGIADFAECLSEKGAELYTTSTCPHCTSQKNLFGSAIDKLKIYVCDFSDNDRCVEEEIQYVPTWKIDDQLLVGEKSLNELSQLTGCRLGN